MPNTKLSGADSSQLFVNQLTVIDCALLHPAHGLTGASWIADVVLEGRLDAQGMLFDFGPAKQRIKQLIDHYADHKLIVARSDPRLSWQESDASAELGYTDESGSTLQLGSPTQAFCVLPGDTADTASLAHMLQQKILDEMPANIAQVHVHLREEAIEGAAYAYCHGLKQHGGNCQRIAHGHRSRIEIFADGQRSPTHEQQWAQQWQDIYIGNRADLANNPQDARYRFGYTAAQGRFELELDATRCTLLDAESTIENIAAHIAAELQHRQPESEFTVRAYEGVNKGAIATSSA